MKTYPIASEYRWVRLKSKSHTSDELRKMMLANTRSLMAVATGEKRRPHKGEWYLSGAVVEAYLAPAYLDSVVQIAKLVVCKVIPARLVPTDEEVTIAR